MAIARLELCEVEGIEHSSARYLREKIRVATCQHDVGNAQEAIKLLQECLIIVQSNPMLSKPTRFEYMIMKNMGCFYCESKLDIEKGKECIQNAILIGKNNGYLKEIETLESFLDTYCPGKEEAGLNSSFAIRRLLQEKTEKYGKNHDITISTAGALAESLRDEGYVTESLETSKSALMDARSVLGPSHLTTLRLESLVSDFEEKEKTRHIFFVVDIKSEDPKTNGKVVYVKRRAKGNDAKYVVEYVAGKKERFKARIDQLLLCENLPVTCHGLVNAAHLNGKKGKVKKYQKDVNRYKICFDEKGIKSCLVRPENLSINI